jgi:hypothetical protein
MGGFDARFRFDPADHDLIAAMMLAARRRSPYVRSARAQHSRPTGSRHCLTSGNVGCIDLLLDRLRRDLPTIAEATPTERQTPVQRRRLADGPSDVLCRSNTMYYDRYYKEGGPDYLPRLRRLRASEVWSVRQLWVGDKHRDLSARLGVDAGDHDFMVAG